MSYFLIHSLSSTLLNRSKLNPLISGTTIPLARTVLVDEVISFGFIQMLLGTLVNLSRLNPVFFYSPFATNPFEVEAKLRIAEISSAQLPATDLVGIPSKTLWLTATNFFSHNNRLLGLCIKFLFFSTADTSNRPFLAFMK